MIFARIENPWFAGLFGKVGPYRPCAVLTSGFPPLRSWFRRLPAPGPLSPPAEWAPGSPPIAPRAINWAAQDTIRDDRKQRRGEQELQRPARIHCLARRAFPRRESPSTNSRSDRPRLSAQGRGHRAWTCQSAAARPAAHGCAQGAERARCDGFRRSHARSSASEILVPSLRQRRRQWRRLYPPRSAQRRRSSQSAPRRRMQVPDRTPLRAMRPLAHRRSVANLGPRRCHVKSLMPKISSVTA